MIALTLPVELQQFVEQAILSGRFVDEKESSARRWKRCGRAKSSASSNSQNSRINLRVGLADREAGRVAQWDGEDIKRQGRALLAANLASA
ncbi:MAG: hypothetical protein ABIZ56_01755 [Chthoniobacteraceae bacterium]